jgi:tetraacyldisaccharide 4'-kinase
LLVLLWPVSRLFSLVASQRREHLQRVQAMLPVPVVVVGNISVGGTGKTPLLCELAAALSRYEKRIGIISRGYGGSYDGAPRLVKITDNPAVVGDEPLLIARATQCPVVIGHDRLAAARYLVEHATVDMILSDDGLQHYALPRSVEIVVLDGERGLGNGFCLPAGPLREPASRLQEVDFVVVNGVTEAVFQPAQLVTQLVPEYWIAVASGEAAASKPLPLETVRGRVHAVAGIGNPARFFNALRSLGLDVIEHPFPDHHHFVFADLDFTDGLPVVMTEKDAVKCSAFAKAKVYALHTQMPLPSQWVSQLLTRIERNFRRTA